MACVDCGCRTSQRPSSPKSSEAPRVVAPWAKLLGRRVRRAGLRAPDNVFGLAWSGAMSAARLDGLLRHLPSGTTEIYLHPATGVYAGSAQGYRYEEELAALVSPEIVAAARDLRLGGFTDFLKSDDGARVTRPSREAGQDRSLS